MATFYLDFENGNDANDGTTFANRWKTLTSGATAARIAPGDTIRMMGSPAPTSLGQNGVWTSQALQATKTITSSTNATPIAITCTSHGYSTGDTVVITGHTTNTNANGTWEITNTGANTFTLDGSIGNGVGGATGTVRLRNNTRVRLTTAVTQNIASTGPGRAAWTATAGGNITTSFDTTNFKEHNQADSIAIAAGFSTGLAAYWPLPSTLNLSSYQQVSFWIQQTAGTVGAAGAVDLRLCSDTAGATAVNTISIPNLVVAGRWVPVTVDLGTNLGSSIQSIALYVNTDNGAQTFLLSNIIACKASSAADSLTLTSLIGKNTAGETFWGIQSINGTRVMLDGDTNTTPTTTTLRGYYGTSEIVTTHKRETIKVGPSAAATTTVQVVQDSGTDGNPITFSGGWDRTNMSTQNLETWLDGQNSFGYLISLVTRRFINFSKIAGVRGTRAFDLDSTGCIGNTFNIIAANNNSGAGIVDDGTGNTLNVSHACSNLFEGVNIVNNSSDVIDITVISNGAGGLVTSAGFGGVAIVKAYNNVAYGISSPTRGLQIVRNSITQDNELSSFSLNGQVAFKNCLFDEATEATFSIVNASHFAFSHDHDQTPGNHKIFMPNALISAATDQRKTASGISWKIQPTNSTNRNSAFPVPLSLAKVACAANSLVTVKAWMRRDNTGLTMRLICKGGQIAGVTNDVVSAMTAAANTWEEVTITFTPTEIGVVEILAEAWGGSTFSGWVDDMTISQA